MSTTAYSTLTVFSPYKQPLKHNSYRWEAVCSTTYTSCYGITSPQNKIAGLVFKLRPSHTTFTETHVQKAG